jgi:predicted O-methyltransferase YrrM
VRADGSFEIDGIRFQLDVSPPPRRPSRADDFTLVKTPEYLPLYAAIAAEYRPRTILELGIFEGGSFVLLDKLFAPDRLAAIELRPTPIAPLDAYCAAREHRSAHYGVSQTDVAALGAVVTDALGGVLDMVVDDASHAYAATRASFAALFPRLSPGGLYIVEDWAWSHWPPYQGPDGIRADEPALTNLLIETIAAVGGGTGGIAEVRVRSGFYVVRKSEAAGAAAPLDGLRLRGRSIPLL